MKIIALNWKNTQTQESAQALLKTVEDVANIYPDYEWIVFPGDDPRAMPSAERGRVSEPQAE
jgi:hypothetical protein